MWNFVENSWVQIKIAFDVRDGFRRTGRIFDLPEDMQAMSPERKHRMTLCNLFANHGQSIEELAAYSEMERSEVISILMEEGLLEEQRRRSCGRIRGGRRATDRTGSSATQSDPPKEGTIFSETSHCDQPSGG